MTDKKEKSYKVPDENREKAIKFWAGIMLQLPYPLGYVVKICKDYSDLNFNCSLSEHEIRSIICGHNEELQEQLKARVEADKKWANGLLELFRGGAQ